MLNREKLGRTVCWMVLIAAATLLVAAGHIATPDGHLRLVQASQLLDQGSFALPPEVGHEAHGNIAKGPEGRRYSVYNPGHIVLLTAPLALAHALPTIGGVHDHYVAAFFGSFLGPLAHFVTAYVLAISRHLLGFRPRAAVVGALVYAFGTVVLPHAKDGFEHPFVALSLICAFHWAIAASAAPDIRTMQRATLLCAVSIGVGMLFRTPAVLAMPGLLIVLSHRRAWMMFAAAIVPFMLILASYNALRFGSPFETGYWQAWEHNAPGGKGYFSTPLPTGAYGLWLSPGKGLLVFAPALMLALSGLPGLFKVNRRVAVAITLTALAYTGFYGMNFAWHGSPWCWGPRYLIPVVPLLMFAFPTQLRSRMGITPLVTVLLLVSVGIQILGVSVDYRRFLAQVWQTDRQAFEDGQILFNTRLSPIAGQVDAIQTVAARTTSQHPVHSYVVPGPWKKHAKSVSLSTDLYAGVDFNAPDFWWARLARLQADPVLRLVLWSVGGALAVMVLGSVAVLVWGDR